MVFFLSFFLWSFRFMFARSQLWWFQVQGFHRNTCFFGSEMFAVNWMERGLQQVMGPCNSLPPVTELTDDEPWPKILFFKFHGDEFYIGPWKWKNWGVQRWRQRHEVVMPKTQFSCHYFNHTHIDPCPRCQWWWQMKLAAGSQSLDSSRQIGVSCATCPFLRPCRTVDLSM